MKGTIICVVLSLCVSAPSLVSAWGGLFQRFNPALLNSNFGYGKELFSVGDDEHGSNGVEEVLKEEAAEDDESDPCTHKKCTANEHCCDGHVCVDTDETLGSCLPIWGKKQGEVCFRDADCETGFICSESSSGVRTCQVPIPGTSGLGEDCRTSRDCNVSRGLCCKLQRRARSQPKRICSYFTDSSTCLGHVSVNQVLSAVEHTNAEKRISGHPDDFLRVRK